MCPCGATLSPSVLSYFLVCSLPLPVSPTRAVSAVCVASRLLSVSLFGLLVKPFCPSCPLVEQLKSPVQTRLQLPQFASSTHPACFFPRLTFNTPHTMPQSVCPCSLSLELFHFFLLPFSFIPSPPPRLWTVSLLCPCLPTSA